MNEYNSQIFFVFAEKLHHTLHVVLQSAFLPYCRARQSVAIWRSKVARLRWGWVGWIVWGPWEQIGKVPRKQNQGHQDRFLSTQENAWLFCIWQWSCLVGAGSPWSPLPGLPHPNSFLSQVSAARCQGALSPQGEPWARCWCSRGEMDLRKALLSKRICIGLEGSVFSERHVSHYDGNFQGSQFILPEVWKYGI